MRICPQSAFLLISFNALAQTTLQNPALGLPSQAGAHEYRFREHPSQPGRHYGGWRGPFNVDTSYILDMPVTIGFNGYCLKQGTPVTSGTPAVANVPMDFLPCETNWTSFTSTNGTQSLRPAGTISASVAEIRFLDAGTGTDPAGGAWRARANTTATDSNWTLIDNAGVEIMRAVSVASSSSVYEITMNQRIIPPADDYGSIGKAGRRFNEGRFNTVYMDACVGAGCGGGSSPWTRDSGTGVVSLVTLTDDVTMRKLRWESSEGSGLFWDSYATVTGASPGTREWQLRDNAGSPVIRFQRQFAGAVVDDAILDMDFLPATTGTRSLGSSAVRWQDGYINNLRPASITPPSGMVSLDGDLTVTAGNSLGLSGNRIPKLWVQDFDCAGTGCPSGSSPWTRNSGTGVVSLVTVTDETVVRKLRWDSEEGSGLYWDSYATATGASPGTREWRLRDNAGVDVLLLQRSLSGTTTDDAILDMDFLPSADGVRFLGTSSRRWEQAHLNKVYTTLLTPGAGSTIEIDGSLHPTSAVSGSAGVGTQSNPFNVGGFRNFYTFAIVPISGTEIAWFNDLVPNVTGGNLGSSSRRVGTLYTQSINCSGGTCPDSKWTDGGATTYLTSSDNVAIGLTSTAFKFEVGGSSKLDGDVRFGGDIFCVTDGGCDIGDNGFGTVLRPANGYFATAIYTFNGAGSSVVRTSLSGSGLIVRDSGGTQVASVSGSSGRVSSIAGFTTNGLNGLTFTSPGGCVFSGGILTTSCATW